jgi:hypothetical protein
MEKVNCWEFKQCGRQQGGEKVQEFGVCPAATQGNGNQTNGGEKSGRFCWAVTGTYCRSEVQGSFARKLADCALCDFYRLVRKEEGTAFEIY